MAERGESGRLRTTGARPIERHSACGRCGRADLGVIEEREGRERVLANRRFARD